MPEAGKRLNVAIDADLHKRLKVKVAEEGITVGQFVKEAIEEKLERESTKSE